MIKTTKLLPILLCITALSMIFISCASMRYTPYADIPEEKIDAYVSEEMDIIEKANIALDNTTHSIIEVSMEPYQSYDKYITGIDEVAYIVYQKDQQTRETAVLFFDSVALQADPDYTEPVEVQLFTGDLLEEAPNTRVTPYALGMLELKVTPLIHREELVDSTQFMVEGYVYMQEGGRFTGEKAFFHTEVSQVVAGAGRSTLTQKGTEAMLEGTLGIRTYDQIRTLIQNNPDVKTIVFQQSFGTVDEAVTISTGRLIRKLGLDTKVLSNSVIEAGAVDLFVAGNNRIVEKGAKIGIHSWLVTPGVGKRAIEYPKKHPAHTLQKEYYSMALGEENGPSFYFRTIEAAPAERIYYMNDREIKKWTIATNFVE